jgi:hypothetical protein
MPAGSPCPESQLVPGAGDAAKFYFQIMNINIGTFQKDHRLFCRRRVPQTFHAQLQTMKSLLKILVLSGIAGIVLFSSGCGLTQIARVEGEKPTPVVQFETAVPAVTEGTNTQQPAATMTGEATSAGTARFVLFDRAEKVFRGYDAQGNITFSFPTPGLDWPNPREIAAFNENVYYVTDTEHVIFHASPSAAEKVNVPIDNWLTSLVISPDQKMVAWGSFYGSEDPSRSAIWVANLDGSNVREVLSFKAGEPGEGAARSLNPLEWTADGKLLFDYSIVGIGGYILYGGNNSLYSLDPATGEVTAIIPAEENHGICLDTYRLDLGRAIFNCSKNGSELVIRSLVDGSERSLPAPDGYPVVGSARYSPDGQWIAHSAARGNPDDEAGVVLVVPSDLRAEPVVIAQVSGNRYPSVQGWLDNDTILYTQNEWEPSTSTIWTVKRDGSGLNQIASGLFAGWIR